MQLIIQNGWEMTTERKINFQNGNVRDMLPQGSESTFDYVLNYLQQNIIVISVYQWEPVWDKLLFCRTDKFGDQFENNMFSILISCKKTKTKNPFKGIFSDSNNIFLWHKSEDINKKRLFPKF